MYPAEVEISGRERLLDERFLRQAGQAGKASSESRRIPLVESRFYPLSPGPEYAWFFRLI